MITGSFYFKKTINGNLIGEFTNNDPNATVRTENANVIEYDSGFTGKYLSTWYDNDSHTAKLEIKTKGNAGTFSLEWNEGTNSYPTYVGEGFLQDENTLIGFYQKR